MARAAGAIWRGFHHAWRYNHRLNRLGSYLTAEGDDGWSIAHAAASGTGPDTARFCDLYTEVSATDVFFEAGSEPLRLNGDENVSVTDGATVTIDLDADLQGREEYAVVLNGFDVTARSDADKLLTLSLSVGEPTVPGDGSLEFAADAEMTCDCGTPECREEGIDYDLDLHYLVIGGDRSSFRPGPALDPSTQYSWSMSTEPDRKGDGADTVSTPDGNRWTGPDVVPAVGLTDLTVDLTKTGDPALIHALGQLQDHADGMHMLELDCAVESIAARNGRLDVDFLLFYKNWEHGMKQLLPDDFLQNLAQFIPDDTEQAIRDDPSLSWTDVIDASLFAHRSAGEASIDATARLLQFDDPETLDHNAVPGHIDWQGENADASGDDAHHETLVV